MSVKILDCTLRDGGYITEWFFGEKVIKAIVSGLCKSHLDFVEMGYLNSKNLDPNKSLYNSVKTASSYLPKQKNRTLFLAMVDVNNRSISPNEIENKKEGYIDGIRVVFYKHQVEEALDMCRVVKEKGYLLFVQPMVTIDYSIAEFENLIMQLSKYKPDGISIVDTFGYMNENDIGTYFSILDKHLPKKSIIGFHSHNNMQLSVLNAHALFNYKTNRDIMVDSSLYGMGRGAGNLNTELIINYYNNTIRKKYNLLNILNLIGTYILPIYKEKKWGYSIFYYLTSLHGYHPNYAMFVLGINPNVTVTEFDEFLNFVPIKYKTICKKDKTIELYRNYKNKLV